MAITSVVRSMRVEQYLPLRHQPDLIHPSALAAFPFSGVTQSTCHRSVHQVAGTGGGERPGADVPGAGSLPGGQSVEVSRSGPTGPCSAHGLGAFARCL